MGRGSGTHIHEKADTQPLLSNIPVDLHVNLPPKHSLPLGGSTAMRRFDSRLSVGLSGRLLMGIQD